MRIRLAIAIVICLCILKYYEANSAPSPGPGPGPAPATSADLLIRYDGNNKPQGDQGKLIDSVTFRQWCDDHHINWRILPAETKFNDDQPKFKEMDSQPRTSDNWMYLDTGARIGGKVSRELPKSEQDAVKIIGGYIR